MELQGYYNEAVLGEMLAKGDISRLEYIYHHSEEMKDDYADFCKQKDLQQTEESAGQFMEYLQQQEQQSHTDLLD